MHNTATVLYTTGTVLHNIVTVFYKTPTVLYNTYTVLYNTVTVLYKTPTVLYKTVQNRVCQLCNAVIVLHREFDGSLSQPYRVIVIIVVRIIVHDAWDSQGANTKTFHIPHRFV